MINQEKVNFRCAESKLKNSLCLTHTLLDNDESGRTAYFKAETDLLIEVSSCTMITCRGMENSEFEDCLLLDVYKDSVMDAFGVDLNAGTFRNNDKWSERIKSTFLDQAKPWNGRILNQVKHVVSSSVLKKPRESLNEHKRNSIDALGPPGPPGSDLNLSFACCILLKMGLNLRI